MKSIRYNGKLDFKIDNIGYVKVMRDENFTVPYRSGKDKYSLILPESGSMSYHFTRTNETVKLFPGDVIFIPKGCPYIATYLQKSTVMNLFMFTADGSIFPENALNPFKKTLPELSQNTIFSLHENSGNTLFLTAKIYEILSALENSSESDDKRYKKIMPALQALRDRYFENHKLSHYAEMCGMSESNFRKFFREYTGKSPVEFRNAVRISQVRRMLDSGEYTVAEAAYEAGFNNMSFFYDVLNKYGGK